MRSVWKVTTGLWELEERGLVTFRWEPLPGETEREAQRAVTAALDACDAAYAAVRAAAPWWKRWLVKEPEPDNPRRGQYRLTRQGRRAAVSRAQSLQLKAALGRPLMLVPMPVP